MNDPHPPIRRFFVAEGMIVVAACAATLTLARIMLPALVDFQKAYDELINIASSRRKFVLGRLGPVQLIWMKIGFHFQSIVLTWMLAYATIRLRRPRPPLRVVSLQPGMVAFEAAATAFALGLTPGLLRGKPIYGVPALVVTCLSVPLAWGWLNASGRRRPEAGWVDRSGRALGCCWWAGTWIVAAFLIYVTVMWDWPGFYVR